MLVALVKAAFLRQMKNVQIPVSRNFSESQALFSPSFSCFHLLFLRIPYSYFLFLVFTCYSFSSPILTFLSLFSPDFPSYPLFLLSSPRFHLLLFRAHPLPSSSFPCFHLLFLLIPCSYRPFLVFSHYFSHPLLSPSYLCFT